MVSAIVLAAGLSARMEDVDKLHLPFGDSSILEQTIRNVASASFDEILLIASSNNKEQCIAIAHQSGLNKVKVVVNEHPTDGMTSSIHKGITHLHQNTKAAFICLGDMPLIKSATYNGCIQSLANSVNGIVVSYHQGERGNPVGFSNVYFNELLAVTTPNGCGEVVKKHFEKVIKLECNDPGVLLDIDDMEGYERLYRNI